jgi:hypothetical protein
MRRADASAAGIPMALAPTAAEWAKENSMRKTVRSSLLLGFAALALLLVTSGEASAQEKAGPWMANLKLGPSIGVSNAPTQFGLVLEIGYALPVVPGRNFYLTFPFNLGFSGGATMIGVPIAAQYDIPIRQVRGLYIYPRFNIGYAAFVISAFGRSATGNYAFITPEFGIKYVLNGRWNFGFEPFSLPILAGDGTAVFYRLLFYAGANF